MELGVLLIPILIILSGAIALVGNIVGRNIGRQRLTLLGLRPRYTAQLITVLTGMVITITTLIVVLLVSNEARVALFRLNELLRETSRLEQEIKRQQDRLKPLALGDIAYLSNQEVVREVIDARQPLAIVRQRVRVLFERAEELARANGIGTDGTGQTIVLSPPRVTWDAIASLVDQRNADLVLRLVANQNTLRGEPLIVFVQLFENARVFRSGTMLASAMIDGRQPPQEIDLALLRLADQAARRARGRVLPAPGSLITSPPSGIVDLDEHRRMVVSLRQLRRLVLVRVVAPRDIFTAGPLLISYRAR
ncbi:MAG: DUF3084 domain-containing protein [Armatimonadetes bacterium]|nr:DUF3084 domain-containing protein [Armatimonadota bacterium]